MRTWGNCSYFAWGQCLVSFESYSCLLKRLALQQWSCSCPCCSNTGGSCHGAGLQHWSGTAASWQLPRLVLYVFHLRGCLELQPAGVLCTVHRVGCTHRQSMAGMGLRAWRAAVYAPCIHFACLSGQALHCKTSSQLKEGLRSYCPSLVYCLSISAPWVFLFSFMRNNSHNLIRGNILKYGVGLVALWFHLFSISYQSLWMMYLFVHIISVAI